MSVPSSPTLRIDCEECAMARTSACADCLVTFVCDAPVQGAVVIDVAEVRALRVLGAAGLVPELRHRRRTG